jgi:signal recognition particle subunit SEC65
MGQMKKFKELFEVMSVQTRKKMGRRMAKLAKSPAFQFKKKKALLKMRNPAKLHLAARKKTVQMYRDKFYPSYADMSLQQKVKIDQLIMVKYGSKIDKISKKVAMKLRKTEMERIKQARKNKSDA